MSFRSLSLALLLAGALFASVGCSDTVSSAPGDRAGTGMLPTDTSKSKPHNAKPNINAPPPIEPINK